MLADARLDLDRYHTLLAENSIAKQTYDDQVATVRQDEGMVASDKAAVGDRPGQPRLEPGSRRRSSGRVGLRQIDAGNQVTANGTTPIAVVTQIDPIDVIFAVPEASIASIVRHANFGAGLPVTAFDRAGGAAVGAGQPRHHRQRHRHHHRHREGQGALRQPRRGAVPQPVRQRHRAGRHA